MLVKEIMNRTGIPSFGLVRMFIEDGLTETIEFFINNYNNGIRR